MNPAQLERLADHLTKLRLFKSRERLEALLQQAAAEDMAYADFLEQVLAEEVAAKTSKNVTMRTAMARFPFVKPLETFDFAYQPSIDRKQVQTLATCHFIEHGDNVLVLGPPGVGKTHLAVALGLKAIEAGYRVLFTTAASLIAALTKAHAEGRLDEKLKIYTTPRLLIIDLCAAASDVESDGQSLTWRGLWPRRLHIASSQPSQPSDEVDVNARAGLGGRSQGFRKHLGKRLAFQVQVGTCVLHRRVQGGMPKPLADRREVNSGLEQVNCRGMSQRVGVYPLLLQGARRGCTGRDVLVEQIPDTEACELAAALVRE